MRTRVGCSRLCLCCLPNHADSLLFFYLDGEWKPIDSSDGEQDEKQPPIPVKGCFLISEIPLKRVKDDKHGRTQTVCRVDFVCIINERIFYYSCFFFFPYYLLEKDDYERVQETVS